MNSQLPDCCWQHADVEQAAGILLFDLFAHEVLLVRDSKGSWRFPSGRLEAGEAAMDAAIREMTEEAGIHVIDYDIIPMSIPLVKPRHPTNGRNHHAKLSLFFPALTRRPRIQITHHEHEPKSTPDWYPVDYAMKLTSSSSRAACLTLGYHIATTLKKS